MAGLTGPRKLRKTMNKTTLYLVVGIVAVTLLLFGYGFFKSSPLGGLVHNVVESFVPGVIVGSPSKAACVKVRDTDESGWSYITYLNGVETVTGGNATSFAVPADCTEAMPIGGR